jgi:pimeloyl-ACP methyl ester carboxylesterase
MGGYHLSHFANDLDRLVEHLHLTGHVFFVGASLGGLATILSQKAKLVAKAIVLVDIAPKMESRPLLHTPS